MRDPFILQECQNVRVFWRVMHLPSAFEAGEAAELLGEPEATGDEALLLLLELLLLGGRFPRPQIEKSKSSAL